MSYANLDRRARVIGAWLVSAGQAGERALLLYPTGLEFIAGLFGCFYGSVVAVASQVPRSGRGQDRLLAVVRDARPTVVLTTESVLSRMITDAEVQDPDYWARQVSRI